MLVEHPTPAMVSITGSVRAGMQVAESASHDVKRVHLELGGKAPVVVFDDADLEAAAEGIAIAGYFNAGQDCTAATRVLAAPGIYDDFVSALVEQARAQTVGGTDVADADYGPLNSAPARASRRLLRPSAQPCRVVTGGTRWRAGLLLRPSSSPASTRTTRSSRRSSSARPSPSSASATEDEAIAWANGRPVRAGLERVDAEPRPGHALWPRPSTSAASGSTAHSDRRRDAPRRVQALGLRQGPVLVRFEDYTRIKHVMSFIGS